MKNLLKTYICTCFQITYSYTFIIVIIILSSTAYADHKNNNTEVKYGPSITFSNKRSRKANISQVDYFQPVFRNQNNLIAGRL